MQQRIALAGYRGIKAELLVAIKKSQPVGIKELADRFSVTANAVRRHLEALETDGVVAFRAEVRGVGAPQHVWSLTEDGEALFPSADLAAFGEILDAMKASGASDEIVAVFRRRWDRLAESAKPLTEGLSFTERAQLAAELLSSEGHMAEVEVLAADRLVIREHHCAIRAVAERFPEVCAAEARFLSDLLGVEVVREAHALDGCAHCAFTAQALRPAPAPVA
jgi:DeoR family suf operon transcriptional repressor